MSISLTTHITQCYIILCVNMSILNLNIYFPSCTSTRFCKYVVHRVIRSFLPIKVGKRRADCFWIEYQNKFSITQSWHNAALMHICKSRTCTVSDNCSIDSKYHKTIISTLSLLDEGYSRDTLCALHYISTFLPTILHYYFILSLDNYLKIPNG